MNKILFKEHYALVKRLPSDHLKLQTIIDDIRKMESGIRGENRLIEKLEELRLPGAFYILSNVQLQLGEWRVQIDCLLITDRCCIVLESKNMNDDLYFEENSDEFYKISRDGSEITYPNPYFQLMKHIRFMKAFLENYVPELKVTGAVVMTAKSSRIRQKPPHYPIFKLESIIEKILYMYNQSSSPQLSVHQIKHIEKMIRKKQSIYRYPPLCQYYRISPNDLILGVECPNCGELGMKRLQRTWNCPICKKNDRNAHHMTVQEYFWLINTTITNKEFRHFCKLDSVYSASRMLTDLNLTVHKGGAWRYYSPKKV
ncbi:nuclease-related domain-containing protein [Psychrobacillus sp. FJAT-51614]|uniref:Nuclease-related domain-containing protein n=1 Tax=Psychrobacillus mangrovi TaxID=3117745 RepID=A0ABU8F3K4_9BACI